MPVGKVDSAIRDRLDDLRRNPETQVPLADVEEVVSAIMGTATGDISASDLQLYGELEELATYIEHAKGEIAALRPDEVKDTFLPSATDELDAIVEATAEATFSIMDATEVLEDMMGEVTPEQSEKLMEVTTKIYEACGFQDITGQRISKVVKTLQHIEEKVDALVDAFGEEIEKYKAARPEQEEPVVEAAEQKPSDEDLLAGPQLTHEANTQAEIDALLASFD
ncbi:MAG: protein phosphatase CheZ [Magnetovibrionaceae bacterium]